MSSRTLRSAVRRSAFTLLEVLVAMSVFAILLGFLLLTINQSSSVWTRARGESASYEAARFGFNLISQSLSQARMGVFTDYYPDPSVGTPTSYIRQSDLNFVITGPQSPNFNQGNSIFFQASMGRTSDNAKYGGLPGLLNSVGYYVTYGKDPNLPPFLQTLDRNRFRLMQFLAPAEAMTTYVNRNNGAWYQTNLANYSRVISDNVIMVLFWPRLSAEEDSTGNALTSGGGYSYDSRTGASGATQSATANQQPPLVQVTLVAIDEAWASRLPDSASPPADVTDCLNGLFGTPTIDAYGTDLRTLEARLSEKSIPYRVLTSMVTLRETKWNKSN